MYGTTAAEGEIHDMGYADKRQSIVDEYAETVERLESALADLRSRLTPVLRLNEPRATVDGAEAKRPAASKAREVLHRLDEQHSHVRELISLLEV